MAFNFMPKLMSYLSLLLLVLSLNAFSSQASPVEQIGSEKIIQWKYYITEKFYGPNATVVAIAGIPGRLWSPYTFGTLIVGDNPVTEDPGPYSRKVGNVRGLVLISSRGGRYNYISSSLMFTNKEYNGSTLQIQGTFNRPSRRASELSIVGGTRKLEGARGSAFLQTYRGSILIFILKFTYYK